GIQYAQFPMAKFELTEPIAIDKVPPVGETIKKAAKGNLTLHGVTRPIALDIQGKFTDAGTFVVVGSTDVAFADYNISPPRAPSVVGMENHGIVELQLTFA